MSFRKTRLDEAEMIFFENELEKVKSKSYDKVYPERKARKLIPVSFDAGEGTETITYEQYDRVGMAKVINNYAHDFERVDIKGKRFTSTVESIGASYGYNVQEIRAAAKAGKNLEQRRANAAKSAIVDYEHFVAMFGLEDLNMPGFLMNPNIPEYSIPDDGVGGSTAWEDKTPAKIIRDIMAVYNQVHVQSKGREQANTILLPLEHYAMIASTPKSDNSDTTILDFVMKVLPDLEQVVGLFELGEDVVESNFLSSTRIIAYTKDEDKLTLEIPVDFEQWEPDKKGGEYEIPCHERIGGVIFYYPLSACYGEGI